MKYDSKKYKSFTLVETLVAIAVLTTSILAPLSIASNSLFQARAAREQIVATYLAQEAVEMIRYVRDRNLMRGLGSPTSEWLEFIPKDSWFEPDWAGAQNGNFNLCPNTSDPTSCHYLHYNGSYSLGSVGDETKFKRAVRLTVSPTNPDEATLESRVYWTSGVSGERNVFVKVYLYNWAVVEN